MKYWEWERRRLSYRPERPIQRRIAEKTTAFGEETKNETQRKTVNPRNEQVIATKAYFEDFQKMYFWDGLKKLENRWVMCIELKSD